MARLPDIPLQSWLSDQATRFADATAGYFPALEFEDGAKQAESIIPPDYPLPGGSDQWEAAEQQRIEDELRRAQQEEEERQRQQEQADLARREQELRAQQVADEQRSQEQGQQATSWAQRLGIPTPDEAFSGFSNLVNRPTDNLSTTGSFERQAPEPPPEPQPQPASQSPVDQFTSWAQGLTAPLWGGAQETARRASEYLPQDADVARTLEQEGLVAPLTRPVTNVLRQAQGREPEPPGPGKNYLDPAVRNITRQFRESRENIREGSAEGDYGRVGWGAIGLAGIADPETLPAEQLNEMLPRLHVQPGPDYEGQLRSRIGYGPGTPEETSIGAGDILGGAALGHGLVQGARALGRWAGPKLATRAAERADRQLGVGQHIVPPEVAGGLDYPLRVPDDPHTVRAIEEAGGRVDPEHGTFMNVIRMQDERGQGQTANRGAPFYTAGPPGAPSEYAGGAGNDLGGDIRIEGETLFRNPLFIDGPPGHPSGFDDAVKKLGIQGSPASQQVRQQAQAEVERLRAVEQEMLQLHSKAGEDLAQVAEQHNYELPENIRGTYPADTPQPLLRAWKYMQVVDQELINAQHAADTARDQLRALGSPEVSAERILQQVRMIRQHTARGSPERIAGFEQVVAKYGGDPSTVEDAIRLRGDSQESEWAVLENIVAHNARRQQHDGVIALQGDWGAYGAALEKAIQAHPDYLEQAAVVRKINQDWGAAEFAARNAKADYGVRSPEHRQALAHLNTFLDTVERAQRKLDNIHDRLTNEVEVSTPTRVQELIDPREKLNPTPGRTPERLAAAREDHSNIQNELDALEQEDDWLRDQEGFGEDHPDRVRIANERQDLRSIRADLAEELDRLTRRTGRPGYHLREDVPVRPGEDILHTTITENPLANRALERHTAAQAARFSAREDIAPYRTAYLAERSSPSESESDWVQRTGNTAAAEAYRRYDRAIDAESAARLALTQAEQGPSRVTMGAVPRGWDTTGPTMGLAEQRTRGVLPLRSGLGSTAGALTGGAAGATADEDATWDQRLQNALLGAAVGGVGGGAATHYGNLGAARFIDSLIKRGAWSPEVLATHPEAATRIQALLGLAAEGLPDDAVVQLPGQVRFLARVSPDIAERIDPLLLSGEMTAGEIRAEVGRSLGSRFGTAVRDLMTDVVTGQSNRLQRAAETRADTATLQGIPERLRQAAEAQPQRVMLGANSALGRIIPLDHPPFTRLVNDLADELGVRQPHIYVAPEAQQVNAIMSQDADGWPVLAISRGFAEAGLSLDEVRAVMTHELAHAAEHPRVRGTTAQGVMPTTSPLTAADLAGTHADAEKLGEAYDRVESGAYKRQPDETDIKQIITTADKMRGEVTDRHAELAAVVRHAEGALGRKLTSKERIDLLALNYPGNEDVTKATMERVIEPEMAKLSRADYKELNIVMTQLDNADMDAAVRRTEQNQGLGVEVEGKPGIETVRMDAEARLERKRAQAQHRLARKEHGAAIKERDELLAIIRATGGGPTHGVETDYQAFQRGFRGYGPPRRMETPRSEAAEARFAKSLERVEKANAGIATAEARVAKSTERSRLRRIDQQLRRGATRAEEVGTSRRYSGGATPQEVGNIEAALKERVGPERYEKIIAARTALYDFRDMMRERLLESEVWDQDLHDVLKQNFPHYSPVRILKYLDESHLDGAVRSGDRSFSVADNGVKALTKQGTTAERMSPVEAIYQMGFQSEKLAQRNAIMRRLAEWSENPQMHAMVQPLSGETDAPTGFQRVSAFVDGQKQFLAVADDLMPALNLGQAGAAGALGSVLRAAKTPLEMGATRGRPGFILMNTLNDYLWTMTRYALESTGGPKGLGGLVNPVNRIKDFKDVTQGYLTAFRELPEVAKSAVGGAVGATTEAVQDWEGHEDDPYYWYKVAAAGGAGAALARTRLGKLSKDEAAMIQRFRESGGSIGGARGRFSGTKDLAREMLGEHPIIRTVEDAPGMKKLIQWDQYRRLGDILGLAWTRPLGVAGSAVELGPRYSTFRRGERAAGDSLGQRMKAAKQAAESAGQTFTSADADVVRQQYITTRADPEIVRAAREITVDFDKGGRTIKKANDLLPFLNAATQATSGGAGVIWKNKTKASVMAGTLVSGLIGLDAYNRSISPEDYANVSALTKNTGAFILSDKNPEEGGKRGLVYIPLRGWLGALVPVTRAAMDQVYGTDTRHWDQIATDVVRATAGNLSPVNADMSVISNLATPPGSAMLQLMANYDFFRGQPIVSRSMAGLPTSEQFDTRTSLMARQLGRLDLPGIGQGSPMKWDWFLRNISPGPGEAFMGAVDTALRKSGYDLPAVETNVPTGARDIPLAGGVLGRVLRTVGSEQENRAYELSADIQARHSNTMVDYVKSSPAYQAATPDRRKQMLRSAEQAMIEQANTLSGVDTFKTPKELGLPQRYRGIPARDPMETVIASALATPIKERTRQQRMLARRYEGRQLRAYTKAAKQQRQESSALRSAVVARVRE